MEGIPTMWNVSDMGTERLSKVRGEFLMYLFGIVEMGAEGKGETFSRAGEEAYHHEIAKKMMTRQMKKGAKRKMVNTVIEGIEGATTKIPTGMVKLVTLLFLQPGAFGSTGNQHYKQEDEKYTSAGWGYYFPFLIYRIVIFGLRMVCGYVCRKRIGIFFRILARFLRQERTMEFQRERDHQQALEEFKSYRGMLLRSTQDGGAGGEWQLGSTTTRTFADG